MPGWDVTTVDYAIALAMGKAPLSDKLNLRRISAGLDNSKSPFTVNKYLRERAMNGLKTGRAGSPMRNGKVTPSDWFCKCGGRAGPSCASGKR